MCGLKPSSHGADKLSKYSLRFPLIVFFFGTTIIRTPFICVSPLQGKDGKSDAGP